VTVAPTGAAGLWSGSGGGGYSTTSGLDAFFSFLGIPSTAETSTASVHVMSLGYAETTVQVPIHQNASIKLHKIN
jgi:hypothetical protein